KLSRLWRALALLPIPALWCAVAHYGWLDFVENRTLDWRFRFRGELATPVKVVYVDIDSESLDPPKPNDEGGIGGWPWSRHYYADVAQALIEKGGAKAVGFDL